MSARDRVALGTLLMLGLACGTDQVIQIDIPLREDAESYLLFVFQEGGPDAEAAPRVFGFERESLEIEGLPRVDAPSGIVRATLFSLRSGLGSFGIEKSGPIESSAEPLSVPFSHLYTRSAADIERTFAGPPLTFQQPPEPEQSTEEIVVSAEQWSEEMFGVQDARISSFRIPKLEPCREFSPMPSAVQTCITMGFAVRLETGDPERESVLLGVQDQHFFRIDISKEGKLSPAVELGRLAPVSAPLESCSDDNLDAVVPAQLLPPQSVVTATVCSYLTANEADQSRAGKRFGAWPGVHNAGIGPDGTIWLGSSAGEIYTLDPALVLGAREGANLAASAKRVTRLPTCDPVGRFAKLPASPEGPIDFYASTLVGDVFEISDGNATKLFSHTVPAADRSSWVSPLVWIQQRAVLASFRNDTTEVFFWSESMSKRLNVQNPLTIGWSIAKEVPGLDIVSGGFEGALARWYWEGSDNGRVLFEKMEPPPLEEDQDRFALRIEAVEPFEGGFVFGGMNGHMGQWTPELGFCPVQEQRTMDVIRIIIPLFDGRFLFAVGGKPASSDVDLPYTVLAVE